MFVIKPLPQDLQKVAQLELNETTERIHMELQALRQWLVQQPHLKVRQDDQFLIQFLRGCKFSLERAKEKLDRYYTLKTKYPELLNLTNVDDTKFRQCYHLGDVSILPEPLNGNGSRITVIRYSKDDFQVSIEQLWQSILSIFEILLMEDAYACINGISFVVDYADCTASHILRFTPGILKKIITFIEMCLPLRLKAVYIINAQPAFTQFFNLVLSFVSAKLRQRFLILGKDHTQLYEKVPRKYLPKEFGGENGSLPDLINAFEKKYDEYRDYFSANAEYGVDEKLRIGQGIDFDTMFGMGGTFRKLDVD